MPLQADKLPIDLYLNNVVGGNIVLQLNIGDSHSWFRIHLGGEPTILTLGVAK